MSGFWSMRRVLAGAVLLSSVATSPPVLAQATATRPAPDPNAPIAEINGREINNQLFHGIIMQVAGMRVFQQVFDLSLVQQACVVAGISLEGDGFKKRMEEEYDRTLNSLQITAAGNDPITREKRIQVLDEVLRSRGITAVEFRMSLETRAGLRALAAGKWQPATDEEIQKAWDAEYNERRTVWVIGAGDVETQAKVRNLIVNEKKKPEEAAQQLSLGIQNWTISKNAENIKKLLDTTWALREGELSAETEVPAAQGVQKVLVMLVKIEPDRTATNPLTEALKADYRKRVNEVKESQWMNGHLQRLKQNANVKINDPVLSAQFEEIARQIQAASSQPAATAPGVQTAPAGAAPTPTPGTALPGIPDALPPAPGR